MNFIMFPVPEDKFTAVCALIGAGVQISAPAPTFLPNIADDPIMPELKVGKANAELALLETSQLSSAATETDEPEVIDAGGHPWNPDFHASTKGTTKDGYWRMKVGVSRPADLPGFPVGAAAPASPEPSSSESAEPAGEASEEDEFAAFRNAAAKTDAEDAKAKAAVPARKWTDADLGTLCNQAAVKLGDPAPIKAIIADYVTEGETPHSRNIAEDKRAEFAAAIEAKAGIEFAG